MIAKEIFEYYKNIRPKSIIFITKKHARMQYREYMADWPIYEHYVIYDNTVIAVLSDLF